MLFATIATLAVEIIFQSDSKFRFDEKHMNMIRTNWLHNYFDSKFESITNTLSYHQIKDCISLAP